jgi:L-iditol 2-dehydrogenase
MDWIVRQGTVRIPSDISFEQASFLEPVNTCMKGIERLSLQAGEVVVVIGQGPIGIILSVLAKRALTLSSKNALSEHRSDESANTPSRAAREYIQVDSEGANGAMVVTSDLHPQRLTISTSYGLGNSIDASRTDLVVAVRELTEGRGADAAILAVGGNGLIRTAMDAVRPGGRVLLFAQTVHGDATFDPGAVCVDEKTLLGSYSASVALQEESVRFVMSREMDLERLISHRFPLSRSVEALNLAAHPRPDSMKIVIQPGGSGEGSRA